MIQLPQSVNSVHDAKQVVKYFNYILGGGFHPDTPIGDYVNTMTGVPTFVADEISLLQPLLDGAFNYMQDTIYDYALALYNAAEVGESVVNVIKAEIVKQLTLSDAVDKILNDILSCCSVEELSGFINDPDYLAETVTANIYQ